MVKCSKGNTRKTRKVLKTTKNRKLNIVLEKLQLMSKHNKERKKENQVNREKQVKVESRHKLTWLQQMELGCFRSMSVCTVLLVVVDLV